MPTAPTAQDANRGMASPTRNLRKARNGGLLAERLQGRLNGLHIILTEQRAHPVGLPPQRALASQLPTAGEQCGTSPPCGAALSAPLFLLLGQSPFSADLLRQQRQLVSRWVDGPRAAKRIGEVV